MSTLVLYVGIAVTFLTLWGVIMVGGYLLGRESADAPTALASSTMSGPLTPGERNLVR